jgi:hypothetical protein
MSKNQPNNSINLRHGGGIVNRQDQDLPSQEPISTDGSDSTPIRPIPVGGFVAPVGIPPFNMDNWKGFYQAVKELCWNNIGIPIDNLVGCVQSHPNKPGYQRGWIFNGLVPTFAPCGCYREAIWPNFLGLGLIAKTAVNTIIIKRLRRVALKDFLSTISNFTLKRTTIRKGWEAIRDLGVDPGDIYRKGLRAIKLPPVPAGHTRLYRAQAHYNLAGNASNADPTGSGRWFTDNLENAIRYIDTNYLPGTNNLLRWGKYPVNKGGHLVYIDVPTAQISQFRMAGPQSIYSFLPDDPNDIPDADVLIPFTKDASGKRIYGMGIDTLQPIKQTWHKDLTIKDVILTDANGNQYNPSKPTVLLRKNPDGSIRKVVDAPTPNDIALNPKIFPWEEGAGAYEFFIDADIANLADKIAAIENLSDIAIFDKLFDRLHLFGLAKDESGNVITAIQVHTKEEYKIMLENSPWIATNEILQSGIAEGERLLTDSAYRIQKVNEWNSIMDEFRELRTKHLDALPAELQFTIDEFEKLLTPNSPLIKIWDDFIYLFIFIGSIMAVTTVVENKYCGPKTYQYSITDILRTIGLVPGYISPRIPNLSISDWDLIREKLINDKARIFWAELDDNCDCNSCPEGWNLCDTPLNFFTDYYNTCIKCQECIVSDDFDPIYAVNSKVPILLSHKSSQVYLPEALAPGDISDTPACSCRCESSTTPRFDKNGNTISTYRVLKDYTPETDNIFEDYNCFNYKDGSKKVDINIPRNPISGGLIESTNRIIIPPNVGSHMVGIPYETIVERKICDYDVAPDGLPESSIFPWVTTSAYKWSPTLGRWTCKQTKECESPQVFTEGVGDNNEYCDCVTINNSSSSSSTSISSSSSSSSDSSSSSSSNSSLSSSSSSSSSSNTNFIDGFPIVVTLSNYTGYAENCNCYDGVYIINEPDTEYNTDVCALNDYVLSASVKYGYFNWGDGSYKLKVSINTVTPEGSFEHYTYYEIGENNQLFVFSSSPSSPWCSGETSVETSS